MSKKIQNNLKKLETRNQMAIAIIKNNNNKMALSKQKQRTRYEIKVDRINIVNKQMYAHYMHNLYFFLLFLVFYCRRGWKKDVEVIKIEVFIVWVLCKK